MDPEKPDPAMYRLPHYKHAAELAAAHLASHGVDWGDPMEMHKNEDGSAYILTYATPRGEIALLGARGVREPVQHRCVFSKGFLVIW